MFTEKMSRWSNQTSIFKLMPQHDKKCLRAIWEAMIYEQAKRLHSDLKDIPESSAESDSFKAGRG